MFCMNCGTKLPDNAVFCFSCGEKLENVIREEDVMPKGFFTSAEEDDVKEMKKKEQSNSQEVEGVADAEESDTLTDSEVPPLQESQKETEEVSGKEPDLTAEEDLLDSEADISELSTYKTVKESKYREEAVKEEEPVYVTNPDLDPYWDDVLPEIEKEVAKIPKDIIVKGIAIVVTLLLVMAWLIFSGPQ